MTTSNKFCPKCSDYSGKDEFGFYEKYGESGCSGIPCSSAEFPDEYPAHCFTDKPKLTREEKRQKKIEDIYKIIRNKTAKKAAEYIVDHF